MSDLWVENSCLAKIRLVESQSCAAATRGASSWALGHIGGLRASLAVAGGGGFDAASGAIGFEPSGARAVAAHGGIVTMNDAGEAFDHDYQVIPELDAFEQWVDQIGDGAVVSVFGIGVVKPVLVRRQQDLPILEFPNDRAVFLARAVGEFVHVIRVHTDRDEHNELPREHAQKCADGQPGGPDEDQ